MIAADLQVEGRPSHKLPRAFWVAVACTGVLLLGCLSLNSAIALALVLLAAAYAGKSTTRWVVIIAFFTSLDLQFQFAPNKFLFLDLFFLFPFIPFFWGALKRTIRLNWIPAMLLPWLVFEIVTTASRSQSPYLFWGLSLRILLALGFAVVVASIDPTPAIIALGATLVPMTIYGLYQIQVDGFGPLYTILNPHFLNRNWGGRATGFFFSDNMFGGFCAILVPMLISIGISAKRRNTRLLCYIFAATGVLGTLASGSRGALLGEAAALAVFLLSAGMSWKRRLAIVSAIAIAFAIMSFFKGLPQPRSEDLEFTEEGRLVLYFVAFSLFSSNPLIGVGFTNFGEILPSFVPNLPEGLSAHDTYLQLLAETGCIGFLLFFLPILYLFYRCLRSSRQDPLALASAAAIAVFLAHGVVDYLFAGGPYLYLFMFVLGTASRASRPGHHVHLAVCCEGDNSSLACPNY